MTARSFSNVDKLPSAEPGSLLKFLGDQFPDAEIVLAPGIEEDLAQLEADVAANPDAHRWPLMDDETKKQRGERGWADSDVWSFDHYLARIIIDAMPLILADGGHPASMEREDWEKICNKIAKGLQADLDAHDYAIPFTSEERRKAEKKGRKAWKLFAEYAGCMWT